VQPLSIVATGWHGENLAVGPNDYPNLLSWVVRQLGRRGRLEAHVECGGSEVVQDDRDLDARDHAGSTEPTSTVLWLSPDVVESSACHQGLHARVVGV